MVAGVFMFYDKNTVLLVAETAHCCGIVVINM